jgi:adenine-specific DNA methylase
MWDRRYRCSPTRTSLRSWSQSHRGHFGYRLYTLCERKGQAEDARAYNELITSWAAIETATSNIEPAKVEKQMKMF